MTVLIVSEPGMDGVFRYVEALIHYLVAQGVRIHFAYSDRRSCDQLVTLVDYVQQCGGHTLNLATGNRPAASDLPALLALRRLARKVRPDVIHSHSSKAGGLARLLPLLGVRTVQLYHPHAYSGMKPQPPLSRLLYDGIERLLGHTGLTVNCSEEEQNYALRHLGLPHTRSVFIVNGVDTALFRPSSPREKRELRREFDLPEHALILGSLGRASAQKDPLTLYRSFARALEREPDLILFHLGAGELDAELDRFIYERGLQKSIRRLRYLSTPADFYRAIDGFILTSLYEGLSIAALEALACDVPMILSEAPGNYSLIRLPLSHLWSAPIGDAEGFARGIVRWAATCRESIAVRTLNHRAAALAHFDARISLARVLALYQHLTAPAAIHSPEPAPAGRVV
jgi:glycosyltransferase involved in cell wall biosynthesis